MIILLHTHLLVELLCMRLILLTDNACFPLEWGSTNWHRKEREMNDFYTQMKKCFDMKRHTAENLNSTENKPKQDLDWIV